MPSYHSVLQASHHLTVWLWQLKADPGTRRLMDSELHAVWLHHAGIILQASIIVKPPSLTSTAKVSAWPM